MSRVEMSGHLSVSLGANRDAFKQHNAQPIEEREKPLFVIDVTTVKDAVDLIQEECDKAFAKDDACPVGTDILYLPDVSQSMLAGGVPAPWDQQLQFVKGVTSQAIKYDDGGIDIWPIYAPSSLEKLSDKEIECSEFLTINFVFDVSTASPYVCWMERQLRKAST
ncbi:hypothetical protein FOXG_14013 [Fusarium oxysporum f. sp. lycopersici 4287]|uniref:Uncharacterized protein n=2 Tax=Fusarium oxysporum TaxID=5507 RepID=A0A0J9VSR7_FUSO4|nr:hypothetical protein FOXG_12526 [Fusarium oxysporum f. sp. lycopersici 4287]XP_018253523.1 hypothetical protein FOXG_14013 [Fusarium oxysporum f. sp. lycopersici 4287]KNB13903.1 hypothetical protein FOXG_12526 [Fusarium oxysporum f. sp. lycopersici 4287]KNB15478.1 hypothetical protein FOXG_14013 [Fusarium oxysporum f. sp. lycopersici 4287]